MSKVEAFISQTVVSELSLGRDYVIELKKELRTGATSRETCAFLLKKIVCNLDDILGRINFEGSLESENRSSISGSRKERSDPDSCKNRVHKDCSKKRKTLPRWSEQVNETGLEGQLDDGYCWRKYGQKDILGATHPRAYYRCSHLRTQGCLATKQVQRKDEDSSIFEVIYRGKHTCVEEKLKRRKGNLNDNHKQQMGITAFNSGLKVQEIQEKWNENETLPPLAFTENVQNSFILSPETSESDLSQSSCQLTDFSIEEFDFDGFMLDTTPTLDILSKDFDEWLSQGNFNSPPETTGTF